MDGNVRTLMMTNKMISHRAMRWFDASSKTTFANNVVVTVTLVVYIDMFALSLL